ncbi:MAG TPA: L,D-transpeptidase family protein [Myxococcota bacterium]|nr:L,D-transpeptidase family protein [Myxococcota bacterium]
MELARAHCCHLKPALHRQPTSSRTTIKAHHLLSLAVLLAPSVEAGIAGPGAAWIVGGAHGYEARAGDSLTSVSARFGVDVVVLARANGLAPTASLALGQMLAIENPHIVPAIPDTDPPHASLIVINVPQRMSFLFRDGRLELAFPIAAGRATWRTPIGEFEIDERVTDKTWIVPISIQEEMRREGRPVKAIVPPGPDNPLGRHWLGLSRSSCGIHGTIAPASIYSLRTHGCIRLHPDDAATLYEAVSVGDPVRIVYEPLLLAALPDGRVCLEAHRDVYRRAPDVGDWLRDTLARNLLARRVDSEFAARVIEARDGIARDVTTGSNGGSCS